MDRKVRRNGDKPIPKGVWVNLQVTNVEEVLGWCKDNISGTPCAIAFQTTDGEYALNLFVSSERDAALCKLFWSTRVS